MRLGFLCPPLTTRQLNNNNRVLKFFEINFKFNLKSNQTNNNIYIKNELVHVLRQLIKQSYNTFNYN